MQSPSIPNSDDPQAVMNRIMAHFDVPAYIRRGRQVQEALENLLERCRDQQDKWQAVVRTRLGLLHALGGDWDRLKSIVASDEDVLMLRRLFAEMKPKLRLSVKPTRSLRTLRTALRELMESIERFNDRWSEHLRKLDLQPINELRDKYNRYYVLEKECVVRSPHVARQGFRPLPPLTTAELLNLMPALPMPRLKN